MLSQWRMKDFDVGGGDAARAFEDAATSSDWIDVSAPGDTYLALHAAGRLPDPFADQNEAGGAWVVDREWWWRCDVAAPQREAGDRLVLTFEGLDTYATVWLNGEVLGEADNMFRPFAFDVTDRLKSGGVNRLAVKFDPPADRLKAVTPPLWPGMGATVAVNKRNMVRKAQFGWGWDWGPTLPTVGIWRPAALEVRKPAGLEDVRFWTEALAADHREATVGVEIAARAGDASLIAAITLLDPSGKIAAQAKASVVDGRAAAAFTLSEPQLWWTHDLGAPALYTLQVRLLDGEAEVERRERRVGVRTIAIDQSPDPDEPGTSFFRFVLNGRPIFSRGACWIPASSFVAALGEAQYRPLLESMADGAMNMVRIWGGGVYEHDAFYEVCDQVGLLVWQDFMFACSLYPEDDPAFVDSVAAEARYQITRLRNHPSMALWCGNNENQMMQDFQRRPGTPEKPFLGARYYDEIIPEAVAALDPTTPYWPGSPAGGPHANSMLAGDVHDWTVWHGLPPVPVDRPVGRPNATPEGKAYTRYAEDMARFVSEYGLHASPALETLKRAIPEAELYYGSPALEHRIKDSPKDKVNTLLLTSTGLPETLQQYVDFTQIMQAEGLKFGIEHFRRRMPHCAGSLIWQYNDCWPCVSWSLMDYNGFAKGGWFYTRRAYAPVLASFKDLGEGKVELWITNEGLGDLADEVAIDLVDLSTGAVVAHDSVEARVAMNVSQPVWTMPATWPVPTPAHALHVRSANGGFPDNRIFFGAIKDLQRPSAPKLDVEIAQAGPHDLDITVSAPAYAYFTHILVPHGWTRFSDNYFDLRPGERRTIKVSNAGVELKPEDVTVRSV